jgi:drug/metabolite transporter (DMT)-like permease/GNAT superfamily N-acetyltransferase
MKSADGSTAHVNARPDSRAVLAAVTTLVVWSSAFAGVSQVVTKGGYGPGQLALLRFLVASATMLIVALVTRQRLPHRSDLPRLALAALFGITIYHLCFTFSETQVSAGAAALIIASGPIWTALLAVAFLGERLNGWGWAGVALAFCGVAAIAFGEGTGGFALQPLALLTLAAAFSTAIYFVLSKKPLRSYSSLEFTSYVIWLGTIPMLVFLPGLVRQVPVAPAWATWTVVWLGIFPGALAYVLWSYALARMPASTTASFLYAQPVLATIVAWFWQGVIPGPVTLVGGALAMVGVILVQLKGRPAEVLVLKVAESAGDREDVRMLVGELLDHFEEMFGEMDRSRFQDELDHFDELYGPPRGRALLATVDGVPVGCALLREYEDDVCELRRVWVRPAFRRRGIARRLLRLAVEEARSLGYRRMQFLTSERFEPAIALYESEGFERIPLYRGALQDRVLAFAKDL